MCSVLAAYPETDQEKYATPHSPQKVQTLARNFAAPQPKLHAIVQEWRRESEEEREPASEEEFEGT